MFVVIFLKVQCSHMLKGQDYCLLLSLHNLVATIYVYDTSDKSIYKVCQALRTIRLIIYIHFFEGLPKCRKFNYGNLNVPLPDQFFNNTNELDNIFVSNFPTLAIDNDVKKKI